MLTRVGQLFCFIVTVIVMYLEVKRRLTRSKEDTSTGMSAAERLHQQREILRQLFPDLGDSLFRKMRALGAQVRDAVHCVLMRWFASGAPGVLQCLRTTCAVGAFSLAI